MLIALLAGLALAEPPCEPTTRPDVIEGVNFWIEWDPEVGDAALAQANLDWAEEARAVYIDQLGYDYPDATVLIELEASISAGGLTSTITCPDGTIVPHITLFATTIGQPGENTTKHEVVHAVQYAYMGSYVSAIGSWNWWMEGHASWLTWFADGNDSERYRPALGLLDKPWIGLHQTPLAYANSDTSRFLYANVLLVDHLDRTHGPEAVRATWEYGGPLSGTPIYFPDALDAAGIDFEPFWRGYLAETVVGDVKEGPPYWPDGFNVEKRVSELPASGTPDAERRPQGFGMSAVHIRKVAGLPGNDLLVEFDGDATVDWIGVLVRADGKGPGDQVLDVVDLDIQAGKGSARLPDFDGVDEAFLVVSPISQSLEPRDYTWSAELTRPEVEEKAGCGCTHTAPAGFGLGSFLLALGLLRRR